MAVDVCNRLSEFCCDVYVVHCVETHQNTMNVSKTVRQKGRKQLPLTSVLNIQNDGDSTTMC